METTGSVKAVVAVDAAVEVAGLIANAAVEAMAGFRVEYPLLLYLRRSESHNCRTRSPYVVH